MTELTTAQVDYLASQRLGRIATAGAGHRPHVVPTSFRYNPDLGTIDAGGIRVPMPPTAASGPPRVDLVMCGQVSGNGD
jgi:nitroimidazol reductase NimA-like FMN-containing flavoprotein (pyridoxamine 5'-phosphate oxidase superfamily)